MIMKVKYQVFFYIVERNPILRNGNRFPAHFASHFKRTWFDYLDINSFYDDSIQFSFFFLISSFCKFYSLPMSFHWIHKTTKKKRIIVKAKGSQYLLFSSICWLISIYVWKLYFHFVYRKSLAFVYLTLVPFHEKQQEINSKYNPWNILRNSFNATK